MISRIAQMCFIPHQDHFLRLSFSILLLMALFGGSVGMEDMKATCFSHFAKSKTGSKGETSHRPWSRCASVWIFLVNDGWNSFIWILPPLEYFFFGMGYIFSFFLFFFFDTPCGHVAYLLWVCIFSLFFLTCLVGMWHTFFGYASFICGWMDVLAIFQVLEV